MTDSCLNTNLQVFSLLDESRHIGLQRVKSVFDLDCPHEKDIFGAGDA